MNLEKRHLKPMTETKRRHLLSVTLKKELYDKVKELAAAEDIPATAWARHAILEKLQRVT